MVYESYDALIRIGGGRNTRALSGVDASRQQMRQAASRELFQMKNMPSGEIFTGPVEESVNGWVRFTYPAIYSGREAEGIELRFAEGKVVDACARKNETFLLKMLETDPGARYLGEFAIGTNHGIDRFTKSILFDEKSGGTIHVAVGAGYPETGSKNQSAVHWDMICRFPEG